MEVKLFELAELIGITDIPKRSANIVIRGIAPLETATKKDISFISGKSF